MGSLELEPLSLSDIEDFLQRLTVTAVDPDDGARFDRIAALESVKAACAGAQIDPTLGLDASARSAGSKVRSDGATLIRTDRRKSTASQLGLARRSTPTKGARWLTLATVLSTTMTHTRALLTAGKLTEKRAEIIVRETNGLTNAQRRQIDRELCADPATLDSCGDRTVASRAKALAIKLDAKAVVDRAKRAVGDRRVTTSPAPDSMAYLTALLPMKVAVTVYATLRRDADAIIAEGDSAQRTRSQIMADLLVTRVLGSDTADDIPVTVNLVISDRSLLSGGDDPAYISEFGPIPTGVVLDSITDLDAHTDLRRIYASPTSGELVAMDSKSRTFPAGLARWIRTRDQVCRTPWCDSPIRQLDHIVDHADGGPTAVDNGAGLCAHCNQVKNEAGWSATPITKPGLHAYDITTPSGRTFTSTAPALPLPEVYSVPEGVLVELLNYAA